MVKTDGLQRFREAQDRPDAGFEAALSELRTTGKRSHWIWYVFPQLAGLGHSYESRRYGIRGREEALEYLADPVLRARLAEITRLLADRLEGGRRLEDLLGSEIDALKTISSLTLFSEVARSAQRAADADEYATFARAAERVLIAAETAGRPRCGWTLEHLRGG